MTPILVAILFALSPLVWAWKEHFMFDIRDFHIGPPDVPVPEVQLVWEYHGPMAFIVATLTVFLAVIFGDAKILLLAGVWLFVEDVAYEVILFLWNRNWSKCVNADVFGKYIYIAWTVGLIYTLTACYWIF